MELGTNSGVGGASFWIQNLVDGVAGTTIQAKHADFYGTSPFQKIEVFDTYAFGRTLLLAGTIVFTEKDEHIYHEMSAQVPLLMHPAPRRVCVIGGGDGGCLREVLKHPGVTAVSIVDIDARVKETVSTYFPQLAAGFADPRVAVTIQDGCSYLENTKDLFDVMIVDSYDPGGPVATLETASFYSLVAAHMSAKGIAVIQTDSPSLRSEVLRRTIAGVSTHFAEIRPYTCTIPSFPGGICSFLACAKEKGALDKFDAARYAPLAGTCKYYNDQVHRGAFMLPQGIRQIVQS